MRGFHSNADDAIRLGICTNNVLSWVRGPLSIRRLLIWLHKLIWSLFFQRLRSNHKMLLIGPSPCYLHGQLHRPRLTSRLSTLLSSFRPRFWVHLYPLLLFVIFYLLHRLLLHTIQFVHYTPLFSLLHRLPSIPSTISHTSAASIILSPHLAADSSSVRHHYFLRSSSHQTPLYELDIGSGQDIPSSKSRGRPFKISKAIRRANLEVEAGTQSSVLWVLRAMKPKDGVPL